MAKKTRKHVVFHSDGQVTDILDKLAEAGIDAVNPLQPEFNDFQAFIQEMVEYTAQKAASRNDIGY